MKAFCNNKYLFCVRMENRFALYKIAYLSNREQSGPRSAISGDGCANSRTGKCARSLPREKDNGIHGVRSQKSIGVRNKDVVKEINV